MKILDTLLSLLLIFYITLEFRVLYHWEWVYLPENLAHKGFIVIEKTNIFFMAQGMSVVKGIVLKISLFQIILMSITQ
jgi:hypothetical protein